MTTATLATLPVPAVPTVSRRYGLIEVIATDGDAFFGRATDTRENDIAEAGATHVEAALRRVYGDHRPNPRNCFNAKRFFAVGMIVGDDGHGRLLATVYHTTPDAKTAGDQFRALGLVNEAADLSRVASQGINDETNRTRTSYPSPVTSLRGAMIDALHDMGLL